MNKELAFEIISDQLNRLENQLKELEELQARHLAEYGEMKYVEQIESKKNHVEQTRDEFKAIMV